MSKLSVVVGGQFGSEAKGALAGRLALAAYQQDREMIVVRVAGPNAGHTAYDDKGNAHALRQIPVAAVTNLNCELVIGPGSEIDLEVLLAEVTRLEVEYDIPIRQRLMIDDQATIITDEHKQTEADRLLTAKLGSTAKGIGAARAERIMRDAPLAKDRADWFAENKITLSSRTGVQIMEALDQQDIWVVIEGTQGYGLGLHAGFYPQCTSSNCRAIDFLSLAGIDPVWADEYEVWVVMRTYPIRVAGNSGPLKNETTWEELGFEPEKTTVTQKVRRVGNWDAQLARDAVFENGGKRVVKVSLSMADYIVPDVKNIEGTPADVVANAGEQAMLDLQQLVQLVEGDVAAPVYLVGTGPDSFVRLGNL